MDARASRACEARDGGGSCDAAGAARLLLAGAADPGANAPEPPAEVSAPLSPVAARAGASSAPRAGWAAGLPGKLSLPAQTPVHTI